MISGTSIRVKMAASLKIQIKGTSINQTSSNKYLGAHLDSTLTLNGNFNSKCKKLSFRLWLLSKLRPSLNEKVAKVIYTSIVIPLFTNCGTVNLNLSRTSLGKLDWSHEQAVGIITKNNPVKITPIVNYVKHHACKIVRRFITRQLPSPMTNYFELLSHLNSTRNNKLLIALPKVRTKAAKNRFYYQGATIYNSLTRYIRMPENEFFKKMSM